MARNEISPMLPMGVGTRVSNAYSLIIFLRNQGFNTFSSVDGIEFALFLFLFLLFTGLIAFGGLGLVAFGKRIADDSQRLLIEKIENSIR